jgi:hypothetical protein
VVVIADGGFAHFHPIIREPLSHRQRDIAITSKGTRLHRRASSTAVLLPRLSKPGLSPGKYVRIRCLPSSQPFKRGRQP